MDTNNYVLGHSPDEIRRLELQSSLLNPPTRHVLDDIGVKPGMRVLDVGTGAGDVAAMLAEYVGEGGHVVAIDRNADVLARARARFGHHSHISFELGSPEVIEGAFDLVIGRYVACFQTDEVGFLRAAAKLVAPGGTIAFIEPAVPNNWLTSSPPVPLWDEVVRWALKSFEVGGARVDIGTRCVAWFKKAGLSNPRLLSESPVSAPTSLYCKWLALTMSSLAPALERADLAKLTDFDLSTLQARLEQAVALNDCQIYGPPTIGAWTRVT